MRATLDLDDPSEIEILKAWRRLSRFGDGRVKGRVSSSGSGIHLKVHGCSEAESRKARLICGDDPKRVKFDQESDLKPKQIMFSSKPAAEGASEWTPDMESVLGEYRRRCPVSTRYPGMETPRPLR
jgi:hypothetical protein